MRFFPHQESILETPNTGEEIIAASDEKQLLSGARKPQRGIRDLVRAMLHKKRDSGSASVVDVMISRFTLFPMTTVRRLAGHACSQIAILRSVCLRHIQTSFVAQSSQIPSIVSSGDASEWMNLGLVAAFHTVTVLLAQG